MNKFVWMASCVFAASLGAQAAAAGDWSGVYIGGHVGGAFGDVDWTNVSNASTGDMDLTPGETISQEPDGILGGAQLGYNLQFTNWLVGIELSGSALDFDDTTSNPNTAPEEYVTSELEWLATAAARFGWTWQDSLFYLKGGYAAGKVNTSHIDPGAGEDGVADSYSTDETHSGWVAGAGLEHQIGDGVSIGLEYNYIDLGSQDHSGITVGGGDLVVNDIDVQLHTITARLNWALWTP
jgi:outer membrane immunogenic protein